MVVKWTAPEINRNLSLGLGVILLFFIKDVAPTKPLGKTREAVKGNADCGRGRATVPMVSGDQGVQSLLSALRSSYRHEIKDVSMVAVGTQKGHLELNCLILDYHSHRV